ncbi:putative repeat protein (TIGR01451 family) [Yoonia maritima]|uniref:Putative repeat protein (TIGR01451 family) n=1 Tax=Yoonia maritima TaxID=1435347 RepID=A0A2T0W3X6_9RHOB|nr:DUF11 domain-containing protein [Yoonia maritima]PRY80160.1 putative repeat protein (TIGR01451 family) [Yoonia maritima]
MSINAIASAIKFSLAPALALVAHTAVAQDLSSTADYKIVEMSAEGEEMLVQRSEVRPGEIIEYTLTHSNNTEMEMNGLSVFAPVPEGVTLALGSEYSSVQAQFEIQAEIDPDQDGLEWSTLPAMRTVIAEDGTKIQEPVPAEAIEAVRWNLEVALAGGEATLNTYRVVVN